MSLILFQSLMFFLFVLSAQTLPQLNKIKLKEMLPNISNPDLRAQPRLSASRCNSVGSNSALGIASATNCIVTSCSDSGVCYNFCLNCQGFSSLILLLIKKPFFYQID